MKKSALHIFAVMLLITINPPALKAGSEATPTAIVTTPETSATKAMTDRIFEIKSMDKSNLSTSEKRELRGELQSIKKQLKANDGHSNGGVYISVGGLLLIIILLIIFL